MEFTKSHGAGNDFVLIEDLGDRLRLTPDVVRALCDRHKGVGADGVIRIAPGGDADFFMDYYNAGGDVAEMCGNGIRCLAKWVADRQLFHGETMRVLTRAGVKELTLQFASNGSVNRVRVDMGRPILERGLIPILGDGADAMHEPLSVDGFEFDAAAVSMGNPHCLLFVDDLDGVPFERLGPLVEAHSLFPAHVNAEFVQVLSEDSVRVRVYERGVGETQACGTGACAVAVGSHLRGYTGRRVAVHLPGGTLDIEWAEDDRVFMTGPVEEVFHGTLDEQLEHKLLGRREPASTK
ncbi:MAG: diaminopimelate epimerase [Actinomycetota bacterium]|nr:diaminopimelate epimerase [Actinomycetota bacterium]